MNSQMLLNLTETIYKFGNNVTDFMTKSVWDFLSIGDWEISRLFDPQLVEWLDNVTFLSIFIGGGFLLFVIYTLIKWVLDIAF